MLISRVPGAFWGAEPPRIASPARPLPLTAARCAFLCAVALSPVPLHCDDVPRRGRARRHTHSWRRACWLCSSWTKQPRAFLHEALCRYNFLHVGRAGRSGAAGSQDRRALEMLGGCPRVSGRCRHTVPFRHQETRAAFALFSPYHSGLPANF